MNFIALIVLLVDMGMSLASWLGIIITVMLAIMSFLFKAAYSRLLKDIDENRKDIIRLREDFNNERLNTSSKMKDMQITILESLSEIKKDFYELRK